jgi:hypothetical protein
VMGEAVGRVVGTLFVPFVVMLLARGLLPRPASQGDVLGAVFGWWVVLIGLIILLLGLLGQAKDDAAPAVLICAISETRLNPVRRSLSTGPAPPRRRISRP